MKVRLRQPLPAAADGDIDRFSIEARALPHTSSGTAQLLLTCGKPALGLLKALYRECCGECQAHVVLCVRNDPTDDATPDESAPIQPVVQHKDSHVGAVQSMKHDADARREVLSRLRDERDSLELQLARVQALPIDRWAIPLWLVLLLVAIIFGSILRLRSGSRDVSRRISDAIDWPHLPRVL